MSDQIRRRVFPGLILVAALVAGRAGAASLPAEASAKPAPKPEPDVVVFQNGERLVGKLLRSNGTQVLFRSESVGDVTLEWSKVKELRSSQKFAVIPKNVKLSPKEDPSKIPQGEITVTGQKIEVRSKPGEPPKEVAVTASQRVIDQATFERAILREPRWNDNWKGTLTAGASILEATQQSRIFNGALSLIRATPMESWLDPRNRTTFNFRGSYGTLRQPNSPDVRTEIVHLDGERDDYFSQRLYAFGQLAIDHNVSQGLDLQQNYGGGVGWTIVRTARESLDVKSSLSYTKQDFQDPAKNQNLFGSSFAESLNRKFVHGITLIEQVSVTPAWSNSSAYTASGNATLTVPVYKRLNFTLGTTDTFLNDPPAGFRKNSLQMTTGLTFVLR